MNKCFFFMFLQILSNLVLCIIASPLYAINLEGNYVQGGMVIGKTDPSAKVLYEGNPVRISPEGVFVIGFDRDEPLKTVLEVHHAKGGVTRHPITIARREYITQRIDGIAPEKVEPKDPDILKRIQAEAALLKKARQHDDPRIDFTRGFIVPAAGEITGVYGSHRILNGKPRQPHYGVDITAPKGTPVKAPADGLVSLVHSDMFFSGGTLIIDHGHGVSSSFLHLHKILVHEGQTVKKGDIIAEVGATGRVTGAHLDWRMNWFTKHLDPSLLVPKIPVKPSK